MKKSKKLLCLLLTFLLVLTSISFSTAKVKAESDDYTDDYVFGEKDFFSASDTPNDKDMTFTATEDGLYSVRIKTIEGFNNLSVAKDADGNEIIVLETELELTIISLKRDRFSLLGLPFMPIQAS